MAGRRFDVADVVEVLQHWQAGHSLRQLSRSLGMGRDRLRQIVATAEAAGLSPGGVILSRHEWEERVPSSSVSGWRFRSARRSDGSRSCTSWW